MHITQSRTGLTSIWRLALSIALLAVLALAAPAPQVAHAADIDVTTTDDELNSDSDCSLREAIEAANTNAAVDACTAGSTGMDTIYLPAGTYTLSLTGSAEDANQTGDLDVLEHLTIVGDGAGSTIIDADGIDRALHVVPEDPTLDIIYLYISGVTITGGTITDADGYCFEYFTSIRGGGGICTGGLATVLTVADSVITGNLVTATGTLAGGGGIMASGNVGLDNCTVSNNSVAGELTGMGGGLFTLTTMDIANSTFSGNEAYNGGAIAPITILEGMGTSTIVNSTLSGNSAAMGGGLGTFTATYPDVTLTNCTVTRNAALMGGAGLYNGGGTVQLKNTIVADQLLGGDCSGTMTSLQYNIDSDNTCNLTLLGDQPSTDPLLGPLQDNGGPTLTHELLAGSPATDGVASGYCTVSTDQRGEPRPEDGDGNLVALCDIGSYEAASVPPFSEISIQKATNGYDADSPPGPYIPVGNAVGWTYEVTNTGDTVLSSIYVTDDQGVAVTCPETSLDPDESMTCTASGTAQIGQYSNTATVYGTPLVGEVVSDSDASHYFGTSPAIDIEKATNGQDADGAPGPEIAVGNPVNWTYEVVNRGNVPLTGITVQDDQGAVVDCPHSALGPAEFMTCTASGVAELGQYENLGSVTGYYGTTQVTDSDASHYLGVTEADLTITKTSDPVTAYPGDQITYGIRVTNLGPSEAFGVLVTDVLPSAVDYQLDTGSCTEGPAGTLTCSLGNLASGASSAFDIHVRVPPEAPVTTITNTATVASTEPQDPDAANNSATANTVLLGKADLSVSKFGKPDGEVQAGEELTYTVIVDNLGPGFAHSVVVSDVLQSNGSFDLVSVTSDRPASCSPTPGGTHSERLELTCGLNEDLEVKTPTAPGRWILTIVVRANEAQSVNNVARVTSSDLDPDLSNNEAIVEHDITEVADLSLDKSVATPPFPPFYAGNNVRFQLQVTNSGPSTAENVVLEDMLPEGVTVVNVNPSQGSCTTGEPGSTPLVCNLGTLGVDVSATVFVILNIDPDYVGSLENDAVVSSDLFDPDNGNNRDYVIVPVSTWSNVFMKKGCGWEEDVLAGEEIQYDILVRNDGPSTVHNYEFWDLLPDDVTYLSYEMLPSTGGECFYTPQLPPMHGGPGQGLHCLLGDIAPSETRVVYLRVLVNADAPEGPLTNEITDWDADSNVYLTGYGDDLYCSNYVINEADLSIRKTADPYKVYAGEQIQYDVSVTNNGPGIAFNVLVTDTFDPGVEYEIDTAGCTVLTTTQTVLLGSSQGDYEDEGGTLFAINPTGHSTTLIGSMTGGDLATEIEYDFLSGKLYATEVDGDPWLHTIDPSTGVSLDEVDIDGYDNVPGLEFVGSTLYGAMGTSPSHLVTINPVTGAVTDIGSTGIYEPLSGLAYDASTSTMYGVTAGGDYAHLVTIDLTTGWATEVGYIEVYGYYVERVGSIEFGPDGKLYGGFTWNAYPYWLDLDYHLIEIDPATGEATDLFNTGFSITGLTLAEIPVPVGLECPLGDIGPGETSTFSVWARVRPDTLGVISNRVDVLSDTEDPNPNNDWDTEASLVLGKADLKVTKFGKPDGVVRAGEELEYTVIVDNLGTGYAHDVVLYDEITASGWEWEIDDWDSNRPASCSETYDYYEESTTLTCRLLDPLEVMTPSSPGRWILKVWVDVYERMSINNVARVVATDFDPDLSNNEAIVEHEITAVADLELDKEAYGEVLVDCEGVTDFWEDEVAAGGLLYYYLDIYNDGPSEAENVVVEDWGLSPYLDIIDVECVKEDEWEECSCVTTELGELGDENRRLECNLGTMEEDDEDEIIITARIPSDVPEGIDLLKNDARVYSDVFDDDNGDNLVTNWTTVSRWADLAVEKTQGPEIALPGMDITYSITVTNLGLSDVEGVFISDTVPVQVLNPTWTCCASDDGECDVPCEPPTCPVEPCPWPDIGLYAQADIPAGEWVIYTVEGTLDWWPCGPFTNTVEVIPPQNLAHPETDVDPCDENNTDIAVNDPVCHFDPLVLKTFPGADSTP